MAVSTFKGTGAGGGLQPREQIFTESNTWTVPENVTSAEVLVVGGGAGGYSSTGQAFGGAGGVGTRIVEVTAGDVIPITVGAAGSNGSERSNGGNSSFGNLITAIGGSGVANPGTSDQAVFGQVNGLLTDTPGHDYMSLTYPIGTSTYTRNFSNVAAAAIAKDYAFFTNRTNSWQYTYIPDPSIRGISPILPGTAYGDSNAHVQYDSGYYYFWHNNSTSSTYHYSVAEPANPEDMSTQTFTGHALPSARMFVAALGKLFMPAMANNGTIYVSADQGQTWTTETATVTGSIDYFASYSYMFKPSWDGEAMIIATQDYTYTSLDGVNWVSHYLPYCYNSQNNGLINKIGPRRYMIAGHHSASINSKYVEFSEDYTSLTLLGSDNTGNIGNNTSVSWYNPGGSPFGITSYQNYNGTPYVYGWTAGAGYDGRTSEQDYLDYRFLSTSCVTAYDYVTDTYAGLFDNGSVFQGYMAIGRKTLGKVLAFNFNYTGSGNGGVGAGGKGPASKWVSTYERTIYSAGPGIEGYGNGAGGASTPGSGGSAYLGVAPQNGLVIVRWWQ